MHVHVYIETRGQWWMSFSVKSSPYLLRQSFFTEPGVQHLMGLAGQQAQGPLPSAYQPLRNRFTPPCPAFYRSAGHPASGPHIWVPYTNIFIFSLVQSETEMPLIPRVSIALWKTHRTWVSIMRAVTQASATYTLAGPLALLFSHLSNREVMTYILQTYLTHHGDWLCVTQSQHLERGQRQSFHNYKLTLLSGMLGSNTSNCQASWASSIKKEGGYFGLTELQSL